MLNKHLIFSCKAQAQGSSPIYCLVTDSDEFMFSVIATFPAPPARYVHIIINFRHPKCPCAQKRGCAEICPDGTAYPTNLSLWV